MCAVRLRLDSVYIVGHSLNDDLLGTERRNISKRTERTEVSHSTEVDDFDNDQDDEITLKPGQAETRDLDLESQSNISELQGHQQEQLDDRCLKYKTENTSERTLSRCC